MHKLQEFVRLVRMGTKFRAVARMLAISPNSERAYRRALEAAGLLAGDPDEMPELDTLQAAVAQHKPPQRPPQQVSTVERWAEAVRLMLANGAAPKAIFDRLRLENPDFDGSLSAIKRLCIRLENERGARPEDVALRVETEPGEIAQVDFGYVGELYDPKARCMRKAYVFVMVLAYSRHMFARIVFDQRAETWPTDPLARPLTPAPRRSVPRPAGWTGGTPAKALRPTWTCYATDPA